MNYKTKLENCPTCNAEKSIKIIIYPVTDKGFPISIFKCINCGNNHTYNSENKLQKQINQ